MPHPIQTIQSDNTKVYKPEVQITQNNGPKQSENIPTNFQIYPQYDEDYNLVDYNLVDLDNNKTYSKGLVDTYFLQDSKIANTIQDLKNEKYKQRAEVYKDSNGQIKTHSIGLGVSPLEQLFVPIIPSVPPIFRFLKNFPNRGRFVYNNLNPASYNLFAHSKDIFNTFAEMSTSKTAPTFFNKNPRWFNPESIKSNEIRKETWARRFGIPEEEIPNTTIFQRSDGTWGFTPKGLMNYTNRTQNMNYFQDSYIPEYLLKNKSGFHRGEDRLTSIGGEHSDFVRLANENGKQLWEYIDDQKLNPQYKLADILKFFGVPSKYTDGWGGKDIGWLVGTKQPVLFKHKFAFDNENYGGRISFNPFDTDAGLIFSPQ